MTRILDGRVIRARSRNFDVETPTGTYRVRVPKRLRFLSRDLVDPLAVGDQVNISIEEEEATLLEVFPRRNGFSRPASGRRGRRQLLAANLDVAIIVLAADNPRWKPATLDRYLVLASSGGVPAAVCLNKIDLDPSVREAPELAIYPALGIPVLFACARQGEGREQLVELLAGRVGVLLGPSGSGKSSLINLLAPRADLRVGEVSERTGKGTHTTTWVEMLDLPEGGHLVDSPGIRVLDLTGVAPEALAAHFPEFTPLAEDCRFPDCRHLAEPDCGVKDGVESGRVARHRYESFMRITRSLEAGEG